jgi:hypothetical protein
LAIGEKSFTGLYFGPFRDRRNSGHDAGAAEQQGVAVGLGARRRLGGDRSAAAGAVLYHHGLTKRLLQALRDQARHHVGRSARRARYDDLDGAIRIGRARRTRQQRRRSGAAQP